MPFEPKSYTRLSKLTLVKESSTGADFASDNGISISVNAHAQNTFRMQIGLSSGKPNKKRPDYALLAMTEPSGLAQTSKITGGFKIEWGNLSFELLANPLRMRLLRDSKEVLASSTDTQFKMWARAPLFAHGKNEHGATWATAFDLKAGEAVYGLGEKFSALNQRGQWVTEQAEKAAAVTARHASKNIPLCWSTRGWGVLAHTTGQTQHGVGYNAWSSKSYVLDVQDEVLDLFFFTCSPTDILNAYSALTGRPSIPPIWSLGAWLARAHYQNAAEVIEAAQKLRTHNLPSDVVSFDPRPMAENLVGVACEWDRSRFDDAVKTFSAIRNLNLKVSLVVHPTVSKHSGLFEELAEKGWLLTNAKGTPIVVEDKESDNPVQRSLSPFGLIDFTQARAAAWWRDEHERMFRNGVDVLKTDCSISIPANARAHNGDTGAHLRGTYPLLFNRAAYAAVEKFGKISPQAGMTTGVNAPMVWGGSSFINSQCVPLQSGAPTRSSWAGLNASIRGALTAGMTGVPYFASDIGGYAGTTDASPTIEVAQELFVRWMQHGIFSSHLQFNGVPDALGAREPWNFGDAALRITREWLVFRTRLAPYIMGAIEESARVGVPVQRAMPLAFPNDKLAHAFETQYLFGPALLVAPVVQTGGKVAVYLPNACRWYDLNTGTRYEGGQLVELELPLGQCAVFGREGHMLALGPVMQHSGQFNSMRPLDEVWIFGLPQFEPCVSRNRIRLMHMSGNAYLKGLEGLRLLPSGDLTLMRRGSEVRVSKAR